MQAVLAFLSRTGIFPFKLLVSTLRNRKAMFQRAIIREFGEASEVVELEAYRPAQLAEGCVRVRMIARSINPSDLITISGAYRSRIALPFLPGFEGVGIVEEIGSGVSTLQKGDRVMPIGSAGAWQDLKDADAAWCLAVCDDISDEQAAVSYVNPMTAWVMLNEIGRVRPGMRIAITAAGSAIGQMMIRIANIAGLAPIAFVRSEESASLLAGASTTTVIYKTADEYLASIKCLANDGLVDIVFDNVGGHEAVALAKILRPNGQFVHYGLLSGHSIPPSFWSDRPDIRFSMFHLRSWIREVPLPHVHHAYASVSALIKKGEIASKIRSRYCLYNLREALIDASNLSSAGKVIIA
ncbi:zinc-dependent alcohol dehydrogenase family protein [Agrobacterium vitis]|uniref:zinc-dependent alcohol dehydrogenase family protein n=1 Tax=Agrobacterium vitis TaxID=373 RepID=UPI001F3A8B17|nr:zinc-dependent alcohol dehydrogenase family protein [Agrobacterium vitis]